MKKRVAKDEQGGKGKVGKITVQYEGDPKHFSGIMIGGHLVKKRAGSKYVLDTFIGSCDSLLVRIGTELLSGPDIALAKTLLRQSRNAKKKTS